MRRLLFPARAGDGTLIAGSRSVLKEAGKISLELSLRPVLRLPSLAVINKNDGKRLCVSLGDGGGGGGV